MPVEAAGIDGAASETISILGELIDLDGEEVGDKDIILLFSSGRGITSGLE